MDSKCAWHRGVWNGFGRMKATSRPNRLQLPRSVSYKIVLKDWGRNSFVSEKLGHQLALLSRRDGEFSASGMSEENTLQGLSQHIDTCSKDLDENLDGIPGIEEGYVGLFVQLLGLDNTPHDRDRAVRALWRHSSGGKQFVDEIVKFHGSINLTVSLLSSDMASTAQAAAGLLRNISSINSYRTLVVDAGAVEEITGLLTRRSLPPEVKVQSICVLWNLSVDEKLRVKMTNFELLPALIWALDGEEVEVKEAATGVLANLTLSECNHGIMVEAGVIPKLANLLKEDAKASRIARQEARNALLELAKDKYNKLLIIEEGVILVPLIGASAYRSFKPSAQVAPSLPVDVGLKKSSSTPSPFGAGKVLLGLNIEDYDHKLDKTTRLAIEGQARQQFLARIGVLEKDQGPKSQPGSSSEQRVTLMSWWDGIPRLVLILGLDDLVAVERAAYSIADVCINEEMRNVVQQAGAIPHLIRLLGCKDQALKIAAACALERLSISYKVRRSIEAHGVVDTLISILKDELASQNLMEKAVNILARLLQTGEEVNAMVQAGAIPGLLQIMKSESITVEAKAEAEGILDEILAMKATTRDKIVSGGGLPLLVKILEKGAPCLQEKAACVLENLAITKSFATAIVEADVESGLKAVLKRGHEEDGLENGEVKPASVEKEEISLAISAASRMLAKLLGFEGICCSIDSMYLVHVLRDILKSNIPLHVKDWVAACLMKLEGLVAMAPDLNIPINFEITLHDRIPKLIEEIGITSSPDAREKAVVELHDIVSEGVVEYAVEIADRGGIFPLVDLLDQGSETTREASLAILYNLVMNDENHPAMVAAGAIPRLERIVRSEGPNWKLALYLLRALPT